MIDLEWPVVSNGVHFLLSKTSRCQGLFERFEQQVQNLRDEGWIDNALEKYERPGK